MHNNKRQHIPGFTVVELMMAIAVLAILTALAFPGLQQFLARNELAGSANGLITGLNLARAEAVNRSVPVAICPSSDGAGCSAGAWKDGWLVFTDDVTPNGTPDLPGETLIRAESGFSSPAVTISGSNNSVNAGITFSAQGIIDATGGNAGMLTLTHSAMDTGLQLTITNTGQVDKSKIESP